MAKKTLRRILELLRGAAGTTRRTRTSIRSGIQEPQQMTALLAPARNRSTS